MTDRYCLHLTSAPLQDVTSGWNLGLKKSLRLQIRHRPDVSVRFLGTKCIVSISLQHLCQARSEISTRVARHGCGSSSVRVPTASRKLRDQISEQHTAEQDITIMLVSLISYIYSPFSAKNGDLF